MADEKQDDAGNGGQDEFTPITSQEELERVLGKRLERERAKFADYEEAKQKASQFDELQESQKSEVQKERERAEAAERRASVAERTALQVRIASEMGVPQEALHGDTEEAMRAAAQQLVAWRDSGKHPTPPVRQLRSGSGPEPRDGETGRAAAALRALRQG